MLAAQRWLPVLRTATAGDAVATARACQAGGCLSVELTWSTPGVLDAVRTLVADGLVVGLGTLRTPRQVAQAAEAGAAYVVSFHLPTGFVEAAHEHGLPAVPGALTPHEVAAAVDAGADAVKVFPARLVVPGYLRDLRAVLGEVDLLVTGGVAPQAEDVRTWLDAGARCVGIGGQLGTASADGAAAVQQRAAALCAGLSG